MTAMAMKTSIQTICLSSPKYNYHDDSILFMLYNVGEICYYRIGTCRFEVKREGKNSVVLFML